MNLPGWTREPLVHFLAAGAALFLVLGWIGDDVDPASRSITVTQEDRARLALQWERTYSRAPTDAELDALTEQFVREEVLYREALRLGLDRDDAVVRKRMATKMDYLAASAVETAQPADDTLQDWLEKYPTRFAEDSRFSFEQRYFADRADAAAALETTAPPGPVGEAISLPPEMTDASRRTIAARFGERFAASLDTLETGSEWQGPILSGFGWHILRLHARKSGEVPPLEAVRQQVENDWRSQSADGRKQEAYQVLRDAYKVEIER
uniref:peptidylprolyl isomerase n=1 Tax=Parerythrobacter lutipelagi TaxID=1964208 RepID=UPI0010F70022|nr:peptidylprolyl isomerase [Parerythrobacter lutipelagi]